MTERTNTSTLVARIDEILDRGIFPDAKAWSVAAGLSVNYVSTLRSRLRSGSVVQGKFDQIQALAKAAGVTTEWLSGKSDRATGDDPLFGEFFAAVHLRPELVRTLEADPQRWHVTTVVRAVQLPAQGTTAAWWRVHLDRLERARYEPLHGTGAEVLVASRKQKKKRRT